MDRCFSCTILSTWIFYTFSCLEMISFLIFKIINFLAIFCS